MDIADTAIIERIERLAYQAGVAAGGGGVKGVDGPHPLLVKLGNIARGCPGFTGDFWTGATPEQTISWAEMHALAKEG